MKKFTLVLGCPGSGKSFLAQQMQAKDPNLAVLDDVSRMLRVTHKGLKYYEVVAQFPEYDKFLLCDPAFCENSFRIRVEAELREVFKDVEFEYLYFENNPDQCLINAALRADGRKVENHIMNMSKVYKIPENIKPIPVWKPGV